MTDPKNMEVEFDSKQLDFAEKSEKFGHLILVVDGIVLNPIPTATHTRQGRLKIWTEHSH